MRKHSMKKALVATCVMAMMMGALTACGSSDSNTEEQVTTEATTTEEETTETTEVQDASSDDTTEAQVEVSDQESVEAAGNNYSIVTLATDEEVENYAATVIETVKAKDWDKLADMLDYPVMVSGSSVDDKATFTSLIQEKNVSDEFVNKISGLSNKDLFANGQGISLGDGDVWMIDKNFDGIEQKGDPQFMIITLNGFFAE